MSFFVWLTSLSIILPRFIYIYIYICVYIYIYIYIIQIKHLFSFICWWTFFCFHTLANAAMNIGVHVSFQISVFVFSRYILRSRLAVSYGSSIFNFFEELPYCFPVTAPSYIPTSCAQGFPFLHIFASNGYMWSFWWQSFWQACDDNSL